MRRTRHLQRLREAASILMCRTAVAALAAALTTGTVVAHADSESYMTCMAMTLDHYVAIGRTIDQNVHQNGVASAHLSSRRI
jgi:hypothetical protein